MSPSTAWYGRRRPAAVEAPPAPPSPRAVRVPEQTSCVQVQIITAGGTAEASGHDDPHLIYGLGLGVNFAADLALARPEQISAWQLPYAASAGMFGSLAGTRANRQLPFGASRAEGAQTLLEHLLQVKADCPHQRFILAGFSQGASVVGDAVAAINAGGVAGLSTSDLVATYLVADPGRSQVRPARAVTSTGQAGLTCDNAETLIPLNQGVPWETIGMTGARPDPGATGRAFDGLSGDVMTFAHPNDLSCSTAPEGFLGRLGAAFNAQPASTSYQQAPDRGLKGINLPVVLGRQGPSLLAAVRRGDATRVRALVADAAGRASSLGGAQRHAILALGEELALVATLVDEFDGEVPTYTGRRLAAGTGFLTAMVAPLLRGDLQRKDRLVSHVLNFFPHHMSYFTRLPGQPRTHGPWTARDTQRGDSVPVDQWILRDIKTRLTNLD